mgnify:FL=1
MAKRETVTIDVAKVIDLGSSNGWSAATVARKIGKHPRWLSEIKRDRNLPSPEEAAQMCVLLQTTPEEILVKPEDIALVNSLLEQEKGVKKQPAANSDEPDKKALLDAVRSSDDETFLLSVLQEVSKKLQEKHHGD